MRFVLTLLLTAGVALSSAQPLTAGTYFRGGYTISSHRSGGTHRANSVRYLGGKMPRTGRTDRFNRRVMFAGHGHIERNRLVYDHVELEKVPSYLTNWHSSIRRSARRGSNGFVFVVDAYSSNQYAYVTGIRFR